jgi:hypothetical protein
VSVSRPPGTDIGEDAVWIRFEGIHEKKRMHCKVELDPAAVVQLLGYVQAQNREDLVKTR